MLSIAKFNQLGGKDVSRADLIELKNLASKEQEFSVYNRVSALLDKYPDADIFTIELDQPINISLAAPSIKDLEVFELDGIIQYVLNGEKAATINKKGVISWHKKGLGSQIREKIRTKAHQGLGAPRHSGVTKDGLDECGRLKKGYRYNFKGEVVKVEPKKANNQKKTKEVAKKTQKATSKKVTTTKKQEVVKKDNDQNKFDFIYEVGYNGGYPIKSFIVFPKMQGLTIEGKNSTVENLISYRATKKALEKLQNLYPNNSYGDKHRLQAKDLNQVKSPKLSSKKITLSIDQKAKYDKELASDNWKKYSKTYREKSKGKTPFDATLVDTPLHKGYHMFIYRKKGKNSQRNFFFPMINGHRLNTTNFARKWEAIKLGKSWIDNYIEKKKDKTTTSKSVKVIIDNLPLSKITLDTNRFQNRSKLNANIVKNIVDNFNETELDPLVVWKSKNKLYLLAGHHRYEGLTQLKKKVAPVKYFFGSEAEAIEFAKVRSNSNRSLETPLERAKIYREMATKKAKSIVESEAKRIEGKNANYILNLAALNTKGEVINAIESLAETTDKQNATLIEKIADWTGQARRNYDQLTNAHEREMFLFLMDKEQSKRITTKAEFLQKIFAIVGAFDFEAKQPLNLKRFKFQTEGEKVYNSEYNDLKENLENKLTEKANLLDRLSNPTNPNFIPATEVSTSELAAKKLVSLNQEIGIHQKKLIELSQNKGKYTKSGDNQIGLFSPAIIPYQELNVRDYQTIEMPSIEFKDEPKAIDKKPNRLMQMHFDSLDMDEGWEELMQNPAKNMKIAIWGPPKNGKTAGALQLANYLTKFGSVLYNFADQGFNKSTKDLWISSGLSENSKAEPTDISTSGELEKEIAKGNYNFVFIDMISDFIRTEKMRPEDFKERFMKRFPNVSFILIFEVTKGGNFKGDQGWTHLVDAIMTVEDFLIENRGRYGTGQKIIWEEGFQKFNPKKYAELMADVPDQEEKINISTEVETI